jgi:hypothetical protein
MADHALHGDDPGDHRQWQVLAEGRHRRAPAGHDQHPQQQRALVAAPDAEIL